MMKPLKKYKLPLVILAAFLALALIFGAVTAAITLSREAKAVFSYRGMTVDEGMYSYFALCYKGTFLSAHGYSSAYDNPVFFRQVEEESGKTYGTLFREELEAHIKSILLAT